MTLEYEKKEPFVFPTLQESDAIASAYAYDTQANYSGLSDKQREACRTYAQLQGSNGKTDAPHKFINQYVRDIVANQKTQVSKKHQKIARTIYNALDNHTHKIRFSPLYRGTETVPQAFSSVSVGEVVELDQFVSMSSNPINANTFCEPSGAMLIINNVCGISAVNNLECEYLGRPGSRFRINKIYWQDWVDNSLDLEHTNLKVLEVTMLNEYTNISSLRNKKFFGLL